MEFWQRRPIPENLLGFLLVAMLWWGLDAAAGLVLDAGSTAITRQRGALLPLIIATGLVVRFYDRMPPAWAGIGVHRWMGRELLAGTLLGLMMALLAWAPGALAGSVAAGPSTPPAALAQILIYFLLGAILEELAFRGYLFQRVVEMIGPVPATLAASALFAALHLENPSVTAIGVVNIFVASIFFSLGYFVTGSLWLPIAAHAIWNITLALVGAPVSGIDLGGGLLRTIDGSAEVIGGGAFGPEGGLAATLPLLLGIWALLRAPGTSLSPYVHASVFAAVYRREAKRIGDGGGAPRSSSGTP
jgi:membrane protease YdiL (CAAX protease family)